MYKENYTPDYYWQKALDLKSDGLDLISDQIDYQFTSAKHKCDHIIYVMRYVY